MTSWSRMTPRAGSCRISDQTWNPPESLTTGPPQSMNRWIPPAPWITRAPGRRRRWKALTTTASTPSPLRSSLVTPRTPARVASGMNEGIASVPRRVTRPSANGWLQLEHEYELAGYRCFPRVAHARAQRLHEPLHPKPVGALHSLPPAAQRPDWEAHRGVAHVELVQQAFRRGRRSAVEDGHELEEQRHVG